MADQEQKQKKGEGLREQRKGGGSLIQMTGDNIPGRRIKRIMSVGTLERQKSKERGRAALGKELQSDEEEEREREGEREGEIGPLLDSGRVELERKVGSGSYGEVYEATYNGQVVAVKVPTKLNKKVETTSDLLKQSSKSLFHHNMMDDHQIKQLRKEIQVLTTKRHPCLLMMMGICLADTGIWIVTEFCGNKDLLAYFEKKGNYVTPMQVCEWRLQVAQGMRWLHSEPCVLHLDLKLDNVFLDENLQAKIGDFGISAITQKQNEKRDGKTMGMTLGNMLHEAPEVIQGLPFDSKADVYGFGILCWEISNATEWDASMSADELSSKSVDELTELFESGVVNGTRRPKLGDGNTRLNTLLSNCWAVDPQKRMCFQEIVPKLKLLTVYSLIPVESVANFWVEKFGDNISVPFKTFMAALSRSHQLINQKEFLNKRAKLAIRRLLQVESDSSPVSVDVFGRFARAFMAFPPMSPSCLVNAFRSPHFDPFATEEDVHSLLEETPVGTGVITYVSPYERHNSSISVILHTTGRRGELEQDLVLADPEEKGFLIRFSPSTLSSFSSSYSFSNSSTPPSTTPTPIPPFSATSLPSSSSTSSLSSSPTPSSPPPHPLSSSSPTSCPNSPLLLHRSSPLRSRSPPPLPLDLPSEIRFSDISELCKWVEIRNEELMYHSQGERGSPYSPSPSPLLSGLPPPPLSLPRATNFSPRGRSGTYSYSPSSYGFSSPTPSSSSSSSSPRPSPLSFRSSPLSKHSGGGGGIPVLSISSPRSNFSPSRSSSPVCDPSSHSPSSSSSSSSSSSPSSSTPPPPHKSSSTSSLFSLPHE